MTEDSLTAIHDGIGPIDSRLVQAADRISIDSLAAFDVDPAAGRERGAPTGLPPTTTSPMPSSVRAP